MKKCIGILIMIGSVLLGLYVGGWLMFIQPIIEAVKALDNGSLTALTVVITLFKCSFATFVGSVIACVGMIVGKVLAD